MLDEVVNFTVKRNEMLATIGVKGLNPNHALPPPRSVSAYLKHFQRGISSFQP